MYSNEQNTNASFLNDHPYLQKEKDAKEIISYMYCAYIIYILCLYILYYVHSIYQQGISYWGIESNPPPLARNLLICSCTIFILTSYSLYAQVDVQYLQNDVF